MSAIRLAETALRAQPDAEDARFLLAELLAVQGRHGEVERLLAPLLSDAAPPSVARLARVLHLRFLRRDFAGVLALWREHPEVARLPDCDVCSDIAWALAAHGDAEGAEAVAEQGFAKPALTPEERSRLCSAVASLHAHLGEYAGAAHWFAEALGAIHGTGNDRRAAAILYNRAYAAWFSGDYQAAAAELQEGLRLQRDAGDAKQYAFSQILLGYQLTALGRYEEAEDALTDSHQTLTLLDDPPSLVDCEINLVSLYLAWSPPHGAVLAHKYSRLALAHAESSPNPQVRAEALAYAALAELALGHPAQGLARADAALSALAAGVENPELRVKTQLARATALCALGQKEAAARLLAEAHAQASGSPYSAQLVALELDRLRGDRDSAGGRLGWFAAQGLMNGVNLARRYFPELNPDAAPETPALTLEVLGPMRLRVLSPGGERAEAVRGAKRRDLLARLLGARLAGRGFVSRLELLDALYPGEDEAKASGALKGLVHALREGVSISLVLTTETGYALGAVASDAEDFLAQGDTQLWRGPSSLEGTSGDALHLALKTALHAEADPAEAARLGRILLEADPYDVKALRLTCMALRRCGDERGLARLYREGRERLAEVGETLPDALVDFVGAVV